jgi:hypothetical protein
MTAFIVESVLSEADVNRTWSRPMRSRSARSGVFGVGRKHNAKEMVTDRAVEFQPSRMGKRCGLGIEIEIEIGACRGGLIERRESHSQRPSEKVFGSGWGGLAQRRRGAEVYWEGGEGTYIGAIFNN